MDDILQNQYIVPALFHIPSVIRSTWIVTSSTYIGVSNQRFVLIILAVMHDFH